MKRKMAFVDLTNYKDWPMGGMLEYELAILPFLEQHYDIDLWGFSVDGKIPEPVVLNGKAYPVHVYANGLTGKRIIPNYHKAAVLFKERKAFLNVYDIVYCHSGSCMLGAWLATKSKTKLIYQQHGLNYLDDHSIMSLIQRPLYNFAQKVSDIVFCVSDEDSTREYANKRKWSKAQYVSVGSPIDIEKFNYSAILEKLDYRKNQDAKKFLYTGRLNAYKNVGLLIEAIKLYVDDGHPDVVLTIAGDGEELENLKGKVCTLGLSNNVKMLGRVSHDFIYNLLLEADVFMTASKGEGCSVSVLEAYASGVPVICGRRPGLEGQMINHKTGIFAEEMTPFAFYKAIIDLNKEKYNIAKSAISISKNYARESISAKIITHIDSLFE